MYHVSRLLLSMRSWAVKCSQSSHTRGVVTCLSFIAKTGNCLSPGIASAAEDLSMDQLVTTLQHPSEVALHEDATNDAKEGWITDLRCVVILIANSTCRM